MGISRRLIFMLLRRRKRAKSDAVLAVEEVQLPECLMMVGELGIAIINVIICVSKFLATGKFCQLNLNRNYSPGILVY